MPYITVQNPIPEGGGGKTPSKSQAKNKSPQDKHNGMTGPNGHKRGKAKALAVSAILFAVFEMLGLYCTDVADGLDGRYFAVVFHWIALCCYVAGPFSVVHEMVEKDEFRRWLWAAFLIPSLLNVIVAYVVWHPEPGPKAHFVLNVATPDAPTDLVPLTNEFLIRADWDKPFKMTGYLIFPLERSKTNVALAFEIKNDSLITPEDLRLLLTVPASLPFIPGTGWKKAMLESPGYWDGTSMQGEQSWEYDFEDMLPGNGEETSSVQITPLRMDVQTYCSLVVRAKDADSTQVSFSIMPLFLPDGYPPQEPFVMEGKTESSNVLLLNINEALARLHK